MWHELGDTLLALIECFEAPEGSGMTVTAAGLDIPLEVSAGLRGQELVFLASPPFTRWKSGFLPAVHMAHLALGPAEIADNAQPDGAQQMAAGQAGAE
jgi:hypothetical protein